MDQSTLSSMGAFWVLIAVIGCFAVLLTVFLYWKIFSKAGFNGAWALLMLVPLGNFIALVYLALAEWPIERRVRDQMPPPPAAPYPPR
jgi:hypothetical protein